MSRQSEQVIKTAIGSVAEWSRLQPTSREAARSNPPLRDIHMSSSGSEVPSPWNLTKGFASAVQPKKKQPDKGIRLGSATKKQSRIKSGCLHVQSDG